VDFEQFDDIIMECSRILGEQCGDSIDRIARTALIAGATAAYSAGQSAVASLDSPAHDISFKDIVKQVFALQAADALPKEGGDFIVLLHPHSMASLFNDATFVNAFVFETDQAALRSGRMGRMLNCQIYVSSNVYENANAGVGSTTDVYSALFIAEESYATAGVSNIDPQNVDQGGAQEYTMTGKNVKPVEIIAKPLGYGNDELNQRGSVGWKAAFDLEILNSAWIRNMSHTNMFSDD